MKLDNLLHDLEYEVDHYHTNKILQGKGLEDDPEWVIKFEQIIEDIHFGKYEE